MNIFNAILLLIAVTVQFLNGAEIRITYSPGFSPVKPFLISINDGKVTVTVDKEKETINDASILVKNFSILYSLNGNYTHLVTDQATYNYELIDGDVRKSVNVYAIDFVAREDKDISVLNVKTNRIFTLISNSVKNESIINNFSMWNK